MTLTIQDIVPANVNLKWLRDNTIYLTKYGSHAYGTSTPESDLDIRGIAIPPKEYYFGVLSTFEQYLSSEPYDLCIFDLRKFVKLALDFNPNAVEILFTEQEDHIYEKSPVQKLFDNKEKFISKKAKHTLSGYSRAQIKRIKTHRKYIINPPTKKPERIDFGLPANNTLIPHHQLLEIDAAINKKISEWQIDTTNLSNDTVIQIKNSMHDIMLELKINTEEFDLYAAKYLGLNDNLLEAFKAERQYKNAKREWDNYNEWKAKRNPKRYAMEEKYLMDTKHCSHCVRLFRSCRELLETGKFKVRRDDAEELLAIKNGAWTYEQLIEFADKEEAYLNELYKTSAIPNEPDRKFINELCMEMIEEMI